jgi:AcrR family transcriptional regulator
MTPRKGTRAARQAQGQQDILGAAAHLLASHGYHGMSMRDLARDTGMSLANLYNYFGSKEDLVFALQTRAFEALIATAEQALASVLSPEARLYAFIRNHVRYITTNRDVTRVLVEEAGELPPKRRRAVRELKERYFSIGHDIVAAITEAGCGVAGAVPLGAATDEDVERSTYNIFGMLNWIYGWYREDRHGPAEDVARSIHRLALCGLVARCPSSSIVRDMERHVRQFPMLSPVGVSEE